ncbi:hypothetical protein Molly5_87 [Maribacter phage Molly_5]|uniref:Uncharacterized protein n=2 Tax=Mollyvirus TaxID=2948826 RepID=A0A8E4UY37_9CAUD|nr:hypothetical protein M1M29_gp087 [Maribacter phage Molly_1]YP_010357334.1 hypothetical protein M1M30_gp085 [Maribacter phage Colly_1]QQO97774.1 hypothetical protein Molly2_87 [Maribacter phage Molly_2]QQO97974.1 hypothetical protein Molly3_87 [Maribacter phage Molly_3]QQO98174.1 hypothetical protein Molly4_87 [Maribacter phage Molly_4]QQO98374.1 hypothetical protein Molly5_87 [Maribacter phage Molly_5]QQO97372.1 hypothetical protein Colly1_85 [Maribacter phage Colly_1]
MATIVFGHKYIDKIYGIATVLSVETSNSFNDVLNWTYKEIMHRDRLYRHYFEQRNSKQ